MEMDGWKRGRRRGLGGGGNGRWHAVRQLTKWQKGVKRQRETWGSAGTESRGRARTFSGSDLSTDARREAQETPAFRQGHHPAPLTNETTAEKRERGNSLMRFWEK